MMVHAAFLGLAEGGASRQVVAAALVALVRMCMGQECGMDDDEELAKSVMGLEHDVRTRNAVGELAYSPKQSRPMISWQVLTMN